MITVPTTTHLNAFGQAATLDDGSGPVAVVCIFDEPPDTYNEYSASVEMTSPVASLASADISATLAHGDTLTTGGKDYEITGIQPDGAGMTKLILTEV